VELTCTFTGEPTPSVIWLRGEDKKGLDGLIIKMSFLDTLYCMITDIRIFCEWINKHHRTYKIKYMLLFLQRNVKMRKFIDALTLPFSVGACIWLFCISAKHLSANRT